MQEKAKYSVTLVFETVIYKSKLLSFKNLESLVFDLFLSKTGKMAILLQPLFILLKVPNLNLSKKSYIGHHCAEHVFNIRVKQKALSMTYPFK